MQVIISSVYLYANWHSISFFADYFVVIGDTSLKKAPVVVSQPCGV